MNNLDLSGSLIVPIVFFVICCSAIGFLIGFIAFSDGITKKEAIENNCAQYNPTNGNFEWIKRD